MYAKGIKYVKELDLIPHQETKSNRATLNSEVSTLNFLTVPSPGDDVRVVGLVDMQRLQARVCSSSDFVPEFCTETMSAGSGLEGATGGRQASPTHLNSPTLLPKS